MFFISRGRGGGWSVYHECKTNKRAEEGKKERSKKEQGGFGFLGCDSLQIWTDGCMDGWTDDMARTTKCLRSGTHHSNPGEEGKEEKKTLKSPPPAAPGRNRHYGAGHSCTVNIAVVRLIGMIPKKQNAILMILSILSGSRVVRAHMAHGSMISMVQCWFTVNLYTCAAQCRLYLTSSSPPSPRYFASKARPLSRRARPDSRVYPRRGYRQGRSPLRTKFHDFSLAKRSSPVSPTGNR